MTELVKRLRYLELNNEFIPSVYGETADELERRASDSEKIKARLELEVDDLKICRSERLKLYIRMEKLELALKHCIRAISEWERKPEGIEPYLLGALDSACKALEWEDEK